MSHTMFSLNIFHKLLISFLVIALFPLVTLWYLSSNEAGAELTNSISQNMVTTVNVVATKISAWEDTNLRVLGQAARQHDISSMMADRQNPILRTINETYEWSYLVFTIAPDGRNIGRSDGKPQLDYADREYFQTIMKGNPTGRQVIISKTTDKPALILSSPIRGMAGELAGVIAIGMHLSDISKSVTDTRIGKTGFAILLDADNKLIAHGNTEKVQATLQDFSDHPALKVRGITEKPKVYMDGERKVVSFARKLPQGWTLLVEQDYAEAFASLESMERDAKILILATTFLVFVVAYLLGKQLTRPINQLTAIAEELSKGQFQGTVPETRRGDEIGALARAIERLGISILLAMDRLRKKD